MKSRPAPRRPICAGALSIWPRYEQRLALLCKLSGDQFSEQALREVARKSEGFSMAYVQEIVVNAVLRCVEDGAVPDDDTLQKEYGDAARPT